MNITELTKYFKEHKDEHRIRVSRHELKPLGLTTITVFADVQKRDVRYRNNVFIFDRRLKVREEIHKFAEAMEAMMVEKKAKYGEDWRQLSADECAGIAKEHLESALDFFDTTEDKATRKLIHAGNLIMMAFTKGV